MNPDTNNPVRIGLLGCGAMGSLHAKYLLAGEVEDARLVAIQDAGAERRDALRQQYGDRIRLFDTTDAMLDSGLIDAVLIATPHYFHPELAIAAFGRGLHVLVEKPAGVYTRHVRQMNEAAVRSGKVFAIMYMQRMRPIFRQLRELVIGGEIGELKRMQWIATHWYRPQNYYDANAWRATWAGEGGGVLINQCTHQFDLWQWIFGLPIRVRAFCRFGQYHDIEVEDDVTAYMEYDNGATATFIAGTGETPGTNRLEVAGNNGKIVLENDRLTFWKTEVPERQFNREYVGGFGQPACVAREICVDDSDPLHIDVTRNWVQAIRTGCPLISPGVEGINALEISNAMLLSTWLDDWVRLPVDEERFHRLLQEHIARSTMRKKITVNRMLDVTQSYRPKTA
ncbi:MAG: Gfo/Idh/MocA family protein [Phycisphaerales bacterium]